MAAAHRILVVDVREKRVEVVSTVEWTTNTFTAPKREYTFEEFCELGEQELERIWLDPVDELDTDD